MKKMTLFTLVLCFNLIAMAQISISGVVTNDSIPLESANIFIKSSLKGIATNSIGEFKLLAKKGDTISVSYLGYKTKEVVLNKTENLVIELEVDSFDEAVVIAFASHSRCYNKGACWSIEEVFERDKSIEKNKLFPNPSSKGIFQLKLIEDYNNVEISIANMSGRIIQNSIHQKLDKNVEIDLSQYQSGIYIINIIADGNRLEPIKAVRG